MVFKEESKYFKKIFEELNNKEKVIFPIGVTNDKCYFESFNNTGNILVGGCSGSGKTSYAKSLISYLTMNYKPSEVKIDIVCSNKDEYQVFTGLPHLIDNISLSPVDILDGIVEIINARYENFREKGCSNLDEYNTQEEHKLPEIVVIIDNLIYSQVPDMDLYFENKKITNSDMGVHFILLTPYVSENYLSEISMNNFKTRFCFMYPHVKDIKNILCETQIKEIKDKGYMYVKIYPNNLNVYKTPYIGDDDIKKIISQIKNTNI